MLISHPQTGSQEDRPCTPGTYHMSGIVSGKRSLGPSRLRGLEGAHFGSRLTARKKRRHSSVWQKTHDLATNPHARMYPRELNAQTRRLVAMGSRRNREVRRPQVMIGKSRSHLLTCLSRAWPPTAAALFRCHAPGSMQRDAICTRYVMLHSIWQRGISTCMAPSRSLDRPA